MTEQNWLLVLLKTDDGKGSATVMCQSIDQDPMFADKVLLKGILGFFWPVGKHHVQVQAWSVPKDAVLNWMLGPLRSGTPITFATLAGEHKRVPSLPGVAPNTNMASATEVAALLQPTEEPATPEPPSLAPTTQKPKRRKKKGRVSVG